MAPETASVDLRELREVLASWCREAGVRLCVLFGSQATGRARTRSDVDVAVWPRVPGTAPAARTRLDWQRELVAKLAADVHLVVVTASLDPVLGREIARDGMAVFQAEDHLWSWERLRLWQLFQDARPFLAREREDLRRYAEEVRRGA